MDTDLSLRQRLRATVLEANTSAGKSYNAVIFCSAFGLGGEASPLSVQLHRPD